MASDKSSRGGNDPSHNPFRNGMLPGYAGKNAAGAQPGPATFAGNNAAADNDPLDPQKIIAGLLRYKWIILLVTLLGGAAAWFYADNATARYRTSGTILIHVESSMPYYSGGDIGSILTRNLGLGAGRSIENQLEVLRSVSFATRVAERVMEQRVMTNGQPFPILFTDEDVPQERNVHQVASRIRGRTNVERLSREVHILSVRHESTDPREAMEMANLILDEYVALTGEQSRESIRATLVYLEDVMLDDVRQRLSRSESDVERFMQEVQGGINLPEHTSRLIDRMSDLDQNIEMMDVDREAIGQQRVALEAELEEIRPGLAEQIKSATSARVEMIQRNMANLSIERMLLLNQNPELRGNEQAEPRLREINRDLAHLRTEIDELISSRLEGAPDYMMGEPGDISLRISQLRRMLTEQQVELFRINALQDRARARLAEFEEQLARLPEQQTRLAQLQRARMLNERMYTDLASRQIELALLEQSTEGSGRIFDYAQLPGSPFYPRTQFILLIGLMLGFTLSAGGAVLLVMLNTRIDSIDVLKQYDLPVMAVVPEMDTNIKEQFKGKPFHDVDGRTVSTGLVALFDPISNVSEAYRRLYNNIRYNNPDSENKVFIVTSPGKGEGKTTAIANLAIVMAESGNKVVLMDCDFRRPRLHRMFGVDKEPGVSSCLFDGVSRKEATVASLVEGLDVISAGPEPTRPGLAVNSTKMLALIDELRAEYDYVLIDTPPYGIITDAAPLIRVADGVMALTRFNVTTTPELEQLLDNLRGIRADVAGTILMDYDPETASGYYAYNRMYAYNYSVYRNYHKKEEKV